MATRIVHQQSVKMPRGWRLTRPAAIRVTASRLMWTFLTLYIALGTWFALSLHVFTGDAVARMALSLQVVAGRDPHLAAIGFVWNPIPSIIEVPLAATMRFQELQVLIGPIVSAVFAALGVGAIFHICRAMGASERFSAALTVAYALNPMIILYAANGMSESALLFFMLWTVQHQLRWMQTGRPGDLIVFSFAAAGATWVRYEALPFIAAMLAGVMVFAFLDRKKRWTVDQIEGTALAVLVPSFYSLGLWTLFNWQIMGDPLYFLRGEYSNAALTAQTQANASMLEMGYHNLALATRFTMGRVVANAPLYFPLALIATIIAWRRRLPGIWLVLLISASVPAFHVLLLYQGSSFGWFRYFLYPFPFAVILSAVVQQEVVHLAAQSDSQPPTLHHRTLQQCKRLLPTALVLCVLGGNLVTFRAMSSHEVGREEYAFVDRLFHPTVSIPDNQSFIEEAAVAAYLDQVPRGLTLIDTSTDLAYAIVLFVRQPERLVTTGDRMFEAALADPRHFVDRILVPAPRGVFAAGRLARAYPELYTTGLSWDTLEQEFTGDAKWRVYRVKRLDK